MRAEVLTLTVNNDPTSITIATAMLRMGGEDGVTLRCDLINGRRDGLFLRLPARKISGHWQPQAWLSQEAERAAIEAICAELPQSALPDSRVETLLKGGVTANPSD